MDIEHISISRKSTFDQCTQLYKYKYHLRLPIGYEAPYFLYGKTVHKIIECFCRAKGKVPINDIMQEVLSGKMEIEPGKTATNLSIEYRRKLPKHIANFLKLTKYIGCEEGLVEWKFEYDLDPPHNRKVVGFIDRLVQRGNKFFILDYKTTQKGPFRKTKQTVISDLQLQCYARVVQREFNASADNIQVALFFVEDSELVSTKFTEQQLSQVEPLLLSTYKAIESLSPDNAYGNVQNHCKRCDYNAICPFYGNRKAIYDLGNYL